MTLLRRSEVRQWLASLYRKVPSIACKGLCRDSCGTIDMHPEERRMIREAGVTIPPVERLLAEGRREGKNAPCVALKDGRCSVYKARPMICRVWGVMETLRCPYGCEVEGNVLPLHKGLALVYVTQEGSPMGLEEWEEYLSDPAIRRKLQPIISGAYDPVRQTEKERKKVIRRVVFGQNGGLFPAMSMYRPTGEGA